MLTICYLPLGPPLEKKEHESNYGLSLGILETLVASLWFSCHTGQNLEHNYCSAPVLSFFPCFLFYNEEHQSEVKDKLRKELDKLHPQRRSTIDLELET